MNSPNIKLIAVLFLISACSRDSHTFEYLTGFRPGNEYKVCLTFEERNECKVMVFTRTTTLKKTQIGKTDHILSITNNQFPLIRIDDEKEKKYALIYYPDLVVIGRNNTKEKTFLFNKDLYLSARKEFLAYSQDQHSRPIR